MYLYYQIKIVKKLETDQVKLEIDRALADFLPSDIITKIPVPARTILAPESPKFYSVQSSAEIPDELLGLIDLTDVILVEKTLILH